MLKRELIFAVESGIKFLTQEQQDNGGFISLSSPSTSNFENALEFNTVFSTSIILQTLKSAPQTNNVKDIGQKAANFLLSQKSEQWSWNYWVRDSKESLNLPYPDDLDDTFCALTALFLHDKNLIKTEAMTWVVKMLTFLETKEGGPYRTWLVKEGSMDIWRDIDLGVNVNIAYFLHLNNISLPNLKSFFEESISRKHFISPYYPKPYPILYFLSRFIKGKKRKSLIKQAVLQQNPKNPLDLALSTTSLINLNYQTNKVGLLIKQLISFQDPNGSWKASVFYTGVNPKNDRKFFAGSEPLTTALCIEAISLYLSRLESEQETLEKKRVNKDLDTVYKGVIDKVNQRFGELGENLQAEAKIYLRQVIKNDKDKQITLLPFFFCDSLGENGKQISTETLTDLGAASVYGWIAYTIYDNFLDKEERLSSLPLANTCLRELTEIFNNVVPERVGFMKVFQKVMDRLEEANTWEVRYCRRNLKLKSEPFQLPKYDDYTFLADRSLGHALGSVAILMKLGFKENSKDVRNLLLFFKHLLIARQINDDAHDWRKDLKSGQVNSVAALLLSKKSKGDLRKLFWNNVIEEVCNLIDLHASKAKRALSRINVVENKSVFSQLIEKQEKSVSITREERKRTLLFLENYEGEK